MVMKLNFEQGSDSTSHPWLGLDDDTVLMDLKSIALPSNNASIFKDHIVNLMRETGSKRIRNAAAIALVDLGAVDAVSDIIDVLRRPEIAEASGTLIYAVDELGASMPLCVLARLLERGSYEARAQAFVFFEDGRVAYDSEDEREGRRVIASLAASDDPEAAEAGQCAIDLLDALKRRAAL